MVKGLTFFSNCSVCVFGKGLRLTGPEKRRVPAKPCFITYWMGRMREREREREESSGQEQSEKLWERGVGNATRCGTEVKEVGMKYREWRRETLQGNRMYMYMDLCDSVISMYACDKDLRAYTSFPYSRLQRLFRGAQKCSLLTKAKKIRCTRI